MENSSININEILMKEALLLVKYLITIKFLY